MGASPRCPISPAARPLVPRNWLAVPLVDCVPAGRKNFRTNSVCKVTSHREATDLATLQSDMVPKAGLYRRGLLKLLKTWAILPSALDRCVVVCLSLFLSVGPPSFCHPE